MAGGFGPGITSTFLHEALILPYLWAYFSLGVLVTLKQKREYHIANLDAALTVVTKVGLLYNKLERSDQKDLLRQMIERVVVNPEGMLTRLELMPPFSYLRHVTQRIQNDGGVFSEGKQTPTLRLAFVRTMFCCVTLQGIEPCSAP